MLDFPLNPIDGQIYNGPNGVQYTWSAANGAWIASGAAVLFPATLLEAAAGAINSKFSSPETSVPKDDSGMTGAALIPGGNNSQRPGTPVKGMMRYNDQTSPAVMEYYDGADWKPLAQAGVNIIVDPQGWFGQSSKP